LIARVERMPAAVPGLAVTWTHQGEITSFSAASTSNRYGKATDRADPPDHNRIWSGERVPFGCTGRLRLPPRDLRKKWKGHSFLICYYAVARSTG